MVITDPAATPRPPLFARLWPRLADRLADRVGPDLMDGALAAGCFAAFTAPVLLGAGPAHPHGPEAAFGALAAAPLIVRRRWPVTVLLVVAAVYVAAALTDVAFTPFVSNAGPNLAIAVFTAAGRGRRPWSLTAAVVAGAATWASLPVALHLYPGHDQDAVQLVAVIVGWVAGDMARAIRDYRQQLQLVQRRRAVEELQLARAEERLRLSREVHDVVSHSLSAIAVQAGVARLVFAEQPDQAGAALSAIETASRSALDELRKLLRQIRDPRDADEAAAPALSDLPALIARLRRAGLDVSCHSAGQPRPYGTAVELSAYRITQEALTNVAKHAGRARAQVEIGRGTDELTITVTDDGGPNPGRSAATGGLGIPGMRERAELLGGTLTAGPAPGGGFAVVARLPGCGAAVMTDRAGDIRVLIADDEALVRAGFMILVDSAPGLSVVGQASDGVQAVRQARALKPDVVLMDIRMPVMGGLEATKLILDGDQDPPPRVLVVTTFDEDEHVFEALRSGASGFVLKDTPPEKLLDAIAIVAAGEALLAPAITRRLIAEFARRPRAAAPSAGDVLAPLTGREREVLQQVAAGSSNAEVAAALHLSVATVKTHISRLLSKLDCRDRAQLVVVAYETGVAVPGLRLSPPRPP